MLHKYGKGTMMIISTGIYGGTEEQKNGMIST